MSVLRSGNSLEALEAVGRPAQRFHLLGKRESNLPPSALGLEIKAAPGDGGESDFAHHATGKGDIGFAEALDISHHVVSAVRRIGLETGFVEDLQHELASLAVGVE